MIHTIAGIGLFIVALVVLGIGGYFAFYYINKAYKSKKTAISKKKNCDNVKKTVLMRNRMDYFWKESMTFLWISVFLIFFIALGFDLKTFYGILASVIFIIISIFFFLFAYRSFISFEAKAGSRLKEFEDAVQASIDSEISFNGDNIQVFSDTDDEFDTKPLVFKFPTQVSKIAFPPLEKSAAKHKIISTRKLEFLILSREYFSICKKASTFNLLEPAIDPKKCVEKKGGGGECDEYYYSQMQNVIYDGKAITIKYNKDTGHEDVSFVCKKGPEQKKAMKALKEKLRLTERQKLQKIQEHKHYEDLKEKRVIKTEESSTEESK